MPMATMTLMVTIMTMTTLITMIVETKEKDYNYQKKEIEISRAFVP